MFTQLALITLTTVSFYADKFEGKRTASGEIFHQESYYAAHRTLPFGTWVQLNHKGRIVFVQVVDRCNCKGIDISKRAFRALGLLEQGVLKDVQLTY